MRNTLIQVILFSCFFIISTGLKAQQGVGIGTSSPNPNAILDVVSPSNNKGILIPRITTAQRTGMANSLASTDIGLLVFDSSTSAFYYWSGSAWNPVTVVQDLQLVGNVLKITNNAGATDIDLSPYVGTNTDEQTLTLSGTDLAISNGNSVDLSTLQDGVDDADNDPANEIQDLQLVGNTLKITNNASATDIDLAPFSGTNTDNQTLSFAGSNLSISGGNSVDLSGLQDGVDDADNDPTNEIELPATATTGQALKWNGSAWVAGTDNTTDSDSNPTNEIQDLQLAGNNLSITNNGSATLIDLSPYLDDTDTHLTEGEVDAFVANNGYLTSEVDGSITNELQTVSKAGLNVTLSNGGGTFSVADNDNSSTNEIQDLQLAGNNLSVTNNGSATLIDLSPYLDDTDTHLTEGEVDAFVSNNGYLTSEVDGSITNELQTVSKAGLNVTLSNGGGTFSVADNDNSTTNEIQDLQLAGNNLSITNNGSATLIDLSPYLDDTDTHLTEGEVDAFVANNGYLTTEVDGSTTNELQTVSKVGLNVTLSNGGGTFSVADNDNSSTNEIQSLSIAGTTLSISGGNSVSLPSSTGTKDAFKAYFGNATTNFSKGATQLQADKKTYDLAGTYDEANFAFKVNKAGIYVFNGMLSLYQDGSGSEEIDLLVFVDGKESFRKKCAYVTSGGSTVPVAIEFSYEVRLAGGEGVQFGIDFNGVNKVLVGGDDVRSYITGRLVLEE